MQEVRGLKTRTQEHMEEKVWVCSLEEPNLSLSLLPKLFCPELKNQEPRAPQKSEVLCLVPGSFPGSLFECVLFLGVYPECPVLSLSFLRRLKTSASQDN